MAFENTDASPSVHSTLSRTHDFLNLLDLHKDESESPSHLSSKSNFAGIPKLKAESQPQNNVLDFATPVFPSEKPVGTTNDKPAATANDVPAGTNNDKPAATTNDKSAETKNDKSAATTNDKPGDTTKCKLATATNRDVQATPPNKYDKAVMEQVAGLDSEATFTRFTSAALGRDTDIYPAVHNEREGTTTYTIEQIGLTDRNLEPGQTQACHFKRLINITVPDNASSLKDCKFNFHDREEISTKEFDALLDRVQKRQSDLSAQSQRESKLSRPDDLSLYTHGIRTGAESADFMALALQLTNGHTVINVDWKSTQGSEEKISVSEAYEINRKGAAQSYGKFEKPLDDAINHIGAQHTDMIAFSHGAMFDTKYLQHRKDIHAEKLNEIIFSHPDVPIAVMAKADGKGRVAEAERLYSAVARHTDVIGSTSDLAMTGAAYNDCEPSKSSNVLDKYREHNRQMEIHARLGNGQEISRTLVNGHGGTYVMETIPADKKDYCKHFVNMNAISRLINDDNTTKLANVKP